MNIGTDSYSYKNELTALPSFVERLADNFNGLENKFTKSAETANIS